MWDTSKLQIITGAYFVDLYLKFKIQQFQLLQKAINFVRYLRKYKYN